MRLFSAAVCSSVVLLAGAATALAEPAWCKRASGNLSVYGSLADVYKEDDPRDAVYTLVAALCFPDDEARGQAGKLDATRQLWSKKLGMNDADWGDAAEWASMDQGSRNSPSMYVSDPKAAWSTWTPVDQYAGILNSTMGDSSRVVDPAYLADALGAKLGEAGRLAYITTCLGSNATPVHWAQCQPDIEAFSPEKLSAELRTDTKHNGYQRMVVRIEAALLQPKLAEHAEQVKALVAKDPGYAKIFALAREARTTFKADARLLELMAAMDDARVTSSRKASEGCGETTWTAWKGVVSKIPAKAFGAIRGEPGNAFLEQAAAVVIGTPDGYLASLSLFLCGNFGDKPDYLIRMLGSAMSRWPGFRGPRTMAHTAVLQAGIELDDRDARLDYPSIDRPWIAANGSSWGGGTGSVAAIKAKGGQSVIDFQKVKFKQTVCTKGHYTNRVTQIRSDGQLVYQYICTAQKTETLNEPPAPPQTVNSRYTEGLKKGMFVSVVEDVVTVAYARDGATVPSMVAGVPVK